MAACGGGDGSASARGDGDGDGTLVAQDLVDRNDFRTDMRALWEDHITWTRLYIVSAVDGLKDTDVTATRLLANQKDIGDAIRPIFGEAAGTKLNELLDEHILIAAELIETAKKGNDQKVTEVSERWYRNGDEIADFLADAGIGPREELRSMMKGHLDATLQEAVARLSGDYEAEITAYDEVRSHILHMSDALADGVIQARPEKFAAEVADDFAALRRDMRALWEDHITWTRLFIVSAVDGLKDVDATAARLLANQKDIGDAMKPIFGDAAGARLNELLDEHILIAAELIEAAKTGDDSAVEATSERWYRNGDEIADFLADAGIGPREELRSMMKGHLDTTLDEAVARLSGDYEAEIAAYDEVRSHIHHLADALADGILTNSRKAGNESYDY